MKVNAKKFREALEALDCLEQDFEMLRDGTWIPDNDSINASIAMLSRIEDFMESL